jgi:hypothetical protein
MRTWSVASVVILGLAAGCFGHGGGGGGAPLQFDNCTGDCALADNPIAAGGARTRIMSSVAFVGARTQDPNVATVQADPPRIDVVSGVAGSTTLELVDGSGRVVATGRLVVTNTDHLDILHGWTTTPPRIVAGTTQLFHVVTRDHAGNSTRGDGAVQFTLDGTLAAVVAPVDGDAIAFEGSVGSGAIHASCPGATVDQTFDVVDPAELTRLDATGSVEPDGTGVVTMVPRTADGTAVYGAPCQWTASDPSVTLGTDVTPTLQLGPGELAVFNLNRPGSFTVTCALPGPKPLSATVTLQR